MSLDVAVLSQRQADPAPKHQSVQQPHRDPAAVYLASLAPSGRASIVRSLKVMARLFDTEYERIPWHLVRYHHVAAICERLIEHGLAPASVNVTLAALRGIARAAWNLGYITAEDYERIKDMRPARGQRLPAGRAATPGELAALVRTCAEETGPSGLRDTALLAVLYAGGLRRSEVQGLDLGHWDPEEGSLRVARGKGNKERLVYLVGGAADALVDWIAVRGPEPGPMFYPINKGGTMIRRRLSAQSVYDALIKRARQAGVAHLSPHDMRRTVIGDLLERGIDISRVKEMAGHASVDTTARYDRRPETERRKAVEVLHYPYIRRRDGR